MLITQEKLSDPSWGQIDSRQTDREQNIAPVISTCFAMDRSAVTIHGQTAVNSNKPEHLSRNPRDMQKYLLYNYE